MFQFKEIVFEYRKDWKKGNIIECERKGLRVYHCDWCENWWYQESSQLGISCFSS